MWGSQELLPLWFLVLAAGGMEHVYRPGRRVCVVGAPQGPESESFVQRVYQPFLTTCDGYRACSTYRQDSARQQLGLELGTKGWAPHRETPLHGTVRLAQGGGHGVGSRASLTPQLPSPGADSEVKEEVQRLQSRVDVLEQKLQLVLAPLHSLASRALEHGLPDPGSLLAHSLQQLDRIDSLSEQISFLEEQLGSCSCKKEV
ncbi:PREDICTED: epidermal growth factor-like protein 7 [Bison bison bison]|uniref:Epidermal growth factor-like protein 7 n=1 Tax=Bison bison bison TaxID=43346 RepID=A0A6P3HRW8_BISBB|nr:PREDICTED: epidermal growth factor-like protein 7 [Bison bison bison]